MHLNFKKTDMLLSAGIGPERSRFRVQIYPGCESSLGSFGPIVISQINLPQDSSCEKKIRRNALMPPIAPEVKAGYTFTKQTNMFIIAMLQHRSQLTGHLVQHLILKKQRLILPSVALTYLFCF